MTNTKHPRDLIARLEAATGASRELDAEIFIAAVHPDWRVQTDCGPFHEQVQIGRIQEPNGWGWRNSPAYTASIDAALTLVPDDAVWAISCNDERPGQFLGTVMPKQPPDAHCYSPTPALAICAAALKAKEQG